MAKTGLYGDSLNGRLVVLCLSAMVPMGVIRDDFLIVCIDATLRPFKLYHDGWVILKAVCIGSFLRLKILPAPRGNRTRTASDKLYVQSCF